MHWQCVNWETRPWITHMSVLLRCALRIVAIAWIDTHECDTVLNCTFCINWNTPVNYTENCRYCLNWHTRPWITLMSMLLCCALIIVAIAWIEKHSVNWHTCNAYCKSLSIHENPGFLRRIRDPGIRVKTRENREGWQGVLTAQNCRKWFHNSVKRCHNSGFLFVGNKNTCGKLWPMAKISGHFRKMMLGREIGIRGFKSGLVRRNRDSWHVYMRRQDMCRCHHKR